jgi:glycogen synthase
VFVTFEGPFAPLAGLAAVMRELPPRMAKVERCLTIAPYFREIVRARPKLAEGIRSTGVKFTQPFGDEEHVVEVFEHVDAGGFRSLLLAAEEFFTAPCDRNNPTNPLAPCNPYFNPGKPEQLLRDSLLLSAAAPRALVELGIDEDVILHLQDWETACAAVAAKREMGLKSHASLLTLHNPYDQPIAASDWARVSKSRPIADSVLGNTLDAMAPPLTTVSESFARELTSDVLLSRVYAGHLQPQFAAKGVEGVANGAFRQVDLPADVLAAANKGDLGPLQKEKARRRNAMIQVLEEYRPREAWGRIDWDGFTGPVFLFTGRDDSRQKGHDVAAAAIERLPRGVARHIFGVVPGDEGLAGLSFLKRLASERAGEVLVFPFRMQRGYEELQRGCSFLCLFSLYEPFGGASEGYAAGAPVVARAAGGLTQQVRPMETRRLSAAARERAAIHHETLRNPTGFLFREEDPPLEEAIEAWRDIIDGADDGAPSESDRVQVRAKSALFRSMADEAAGALRDAIDLYQNDPAGYAKMIAAGCEMVAEFSWERAIAKYRAIYDRLSK